MKLIEATVQAAKTLRGKLSGFRASFQEIETEPRATKPEALAELARLIAFRCQEHSTDVNIVTARGHVGVFSYSLHGYVESRHVWPDGSVGVCIGGKSLTQAEDSFRGHVAQITWDGVSLDSAILPASGQGEFKSWAQFQLRYRYAHQTLAMDTVAAHAYACNPANPSTGPALQPAQLPAA